MSDKVTLDHEDLRLQSAWRKLQKKLAGVKGKVLVTAADTVASFLGSKLVAGTNITLTTLNPGGDEQIQIAATGGGAGGLSSSVYVDFVGGSDVTGTRGDISKAFKTLSAGLAVAQAGDVIDMSAGDHDLGGDVTLPNLDRLSILGHGRETTRLTNGRIVYTAPAGNNVLNLQIANLWINVFSAGNALIDLNGAGDNDLGGQSIVLRNLRLSNFNQPNIKVTRGNKIFVENVLSTGHIVFENVAEPRVNNCEFDTLQVDWQSANPTPQLAKDFCRVTATTMDEYQVTNQGRLWCEEGCYTSGNITCTLNDSALGDRGIVEYHGHMNGAVTINIDAVNESSAPVWVNFDNATLVSTFTLQDNGSSTQKFRATAINANFLQTLANQINALDFCLLYLWGARFVQKNLQVTGTGGIARDVWRQSVPTGGGIVVFANSGGNVPFIADDTTAANQYTVSVELQNVADGPVQISGKAASQVTVTPSAANNPMEIVVTAQYNFP